MRRPSHYVKMKVLGAIDLTEGQTTRERIRRVSQMTFEDEEGRPWRFTWRTIETWRVRFRKHGITGMLPRPRSDKGKPRKVHLEAVAEAVEQVLPLFRGKAVRKAHVYRACIERGLLRRTQIAPNTFSRLVDELDLLRPQAETNNKKRLAFSKPYANDMWQADTLYGPHVRDGAKPRPTRLICFIDDASRVVPHGQFFFHENIETLIHTLRAAFYKRGLPQQIYVDNGSIYTSKEIIVLCARLGITLSHAPVRDGAAKGKIERFFRTVREEFFARQLDLSSLEALNRQFIPWVEEEYNTRQHSTLQMRPIDRFGLDLQRIRYLPPNDANDELFYVQDDRAVKKDNTFSLRGVRFEAPRDLRARKVQVRYDRRRFERVIVYYKDQRMGQAKPLDPVANDRKPAALKKGALS